MKNELKTYTILFRTANKIEQAIKEDLKDYPINVTEFGVLEALYHKGPLAVQAVKEKVLIANSSLSYVITTLINKAYIQKQIDESDHRIHTLSLTDKGSNLMNVIYPIHVERQRQLLDILSDEEEIILQTLLKKIGLHSTPYKKD